MNNEQIGINYANCNDPNWHKLNGCGNDVVAVRQFMMGESQFKKCGNGNVR